MIVSRFSISTELTRQPSPLRGWIFHPPQEERVQRTSRSHCCVLPLLRHPTAIVLGLKQACTLTAKANRREFIIFYVTCPPTPGRPRDAWILAQHILQFPMGSACLLPNIWVVIYIQVSYILQSISQNSVTLYLMQLKRDPLLLFYITSYLHYMPSGSLLVNILISFRSFHRKF